MSDQQQNDPQPGQPVRRKITLDSGPARGEQAPLRPSRSRSPRAVPTGGATVATAAVSPAFRPAFAEPVPVAGINFDDDTPTAAGASRIAIVADAVSAAAAIAFALLIANELLPLF